MSVQIKGSVTNSRSIGGGIVSTRTIRGRVDNQTETETVSGTISNGQQLSGSAGLPSAVAGGLYKPEIEYVPEYEGPYEVTPKAYQEQILETAQKKMQQDVTVHEVPYYVTSNATGDTVYIASEV